MAFKMGDVLIKCGQEIGPVGLVSIFRENFFPEYLCSLLSASYQCFVGIDWICCWLVSDIKCMLGENCNKNDDLKKKNDKLKDKNNVRDIV
jgi:hypothetical protein